MKHTKLGTGLAVLFFLLTQKGSAATNRVPETEPVKMPVFSVEALKEDFLQLRHAFEHMHPAKYKFTSRADFDHWFTNRLAMINQPMKARDFYPILAPFFGLAGCGHTRLTPPDLFWPVEKAGLIPLKVYMIGGDAYAVGAYSHPAAIPFGSRILSINEKPMKEILKTLKNNIHSDAFSESFKIRRLQRNFARSYAMQFGFFDHFDFVFSSPTAGSHPGKVRMKSVSLDATKPESWMIRHELKCNPEKNYALLTINSFSSYPNLERVKEFINNSFSEIARNNISNLILDLRENTGGDPNFAAYLLSYIEPEAVIYFEKPYDEYEDLARPIPPAVENRFSGKVYVLIDGEGFSTTGHFCALLKYHRIGTLIGEELGSTYTCNDNSQNLILKNTGFKIRMPTRSYAVAVKNISDRRGIPPDHFVAETIEDVIKGRDAVLEFAMNLIMKSGLSQVNEKDENRR